MNKVVFSGHCITLILPNLDHSSSTLSKYTIEANLQLQRKSKTNLHIRDSIPRSTSIQINKCCQKHINYV